MSKQFLTPRELYERWGGTVAENTLVNWRAMRTGPGFIKLGHKVVYPLSEVESWEQANTVRTTAPDSGSTT